MTIPSLQEVTMKCHTKAARAHFIFAAVYSLPLAALLASAALIGVEPDWRLEAFVALLVVAHLLVGWGAWRARNWARVITLAFAFPALLVVPLGTLMAILLISYCSPAWTGR